MSNSRNLMPIFNRFSNQFRHNKEIESMATYLNDARKHAEKIEDYYSNAGASGYSQSEFHEIAIDKLLKRAHESQHAKNDVAAIQDILTKARAKMQEMKTRQIG